MKYTVKPTSKFQKDLKRIQKRGYDMRLMTDIIKKLANGEILPPKNRDHNLSGNYSNCRECHIAPDWLLIYEVYEDELFLYLTRTGSHSDWPKQTEMSASGASKSTSGVSAGLSFMRASSTSVTMSTWSGW